MAELFARYGYRCWICREMIDPALRSPHPASSSTDHVIPRALGGSDEIENLRPTHRHCNASRGIGKVGKQFPGLAEDPVEWMAWEEAAS
jgi:5-methylcytosine-specific restriction endonuclease McrA